MIDFSRTTLLRNRNFAVAIIIAIFGVSAVAVLVFTPGIFVEETVWRGYYVLLVDGEAELNPILDTFEANGILHISPRNTSVTINTFSGIEKVPLSDIGLRLEADDPRYDPYISGLDGYFTGYYKANAWHVLYLRVHNSPMVTRIRISNLLGSLGIDHRMPEWDGRWYIAAYLVFSCLAAFLIQRRGSGRLMIAAVSLPLLVFVIRGSRLGLASAAVMLPGWIALSGQFVVTVKNFIYEKTWRIDKTEAFRGGIVFAIGISVAALLALFHDDPRRYLLLLCLAVTALLGGLCALFGFLVWRSYRNEHKLFLSLRLSLESFFGLHKRGLFSGGPYSTLALMSLFVVPVLVLSFRLGTGMEIPLPVRVVSAGSFTLDDLEVVHGHAPAGSIPDLSDFITHRAYQDALLYTRIWRFPAEKSGVNIRRYVEDGGKIIPIDSTVLTYDSQWFKRVISEASSTGIESMLLAQPRPGAVVVASSAKRTELLRQLVAALFFISPLLFIRFNLTSQYIYGMRNLLLRRKRQTA